MRVLSLTDEAEDPLAVEPLFVVRCSPALVRRVLRLVAVELTADPPELMEGNRTRALHGGPPALRPVPDR
jgi:hypothetical protein